MNNYFENKDIYLRALEPEDLDILYKWENDTSLWNKGGSMTPYSRYILKQYIANSLQDIYELKQLRMMVVAKKTDIAVGNIDLYEFDAKNKRAGIGVLIDEEYQKRGYAYQALECIARYAFSYLNLHQIYAYIATDNIASISLFNKSGFKQTAKLSEWLNVGNTFKDVIIMQKLNY